MGRNHGRGLLILRLTYIEERPPEFAAIVVPTVSNLHRVLNEGSGSCYPSLKGGRGSWPASKLSLLSPVLLSAGYHSHRQEPIGGLVEIGGDVNGDLAETRDPGWGGGVRSSGTGRLPA